MGMKFDINNLVISFEVYKTDAIVGIGSRINKKDSVGFFDLDKMTREKAEIIIKKLQVKHKLGDFLLFESSENNYHGVCLEVKPLLDWIKIMAGVNIVHAGLSLYKGEGVMRVSSKFGNFMKFIEMIPSGNVKKLSECHVDYFRDEFKVPLVVNPDDLVKGCFNYHFYKQKKRFI